MEITQIISIGASIIVSLGGAGAIIIGLSSWIGKLFAEKMMNNQKSQHEQALEKLRADLNKENNKEIEQIKSDLLSGNHRNLKSFHERLAIYKVVVDIFADFLFDVQIHFASKGQIQIGNAKLIEFEKLRMRTFGYLALLASQDVIDAHEKLVGTILYILEGEEEFSWDTIRGACMEFLNVSRADLGLDNTKIEYRDTR